MHVKTHFCTKNLGGCSCGKGPIEVGDRVRTAHGPTGDDVGIVVRVEEAVCLVQMGVTHEDVAQVWCEVNLDGDADRLTLLDWRSDGYGRIVHVV